MLTVDKCDILWTVAKSQQTVTMKVCIEPQPLIIASNISDLIIPSLQNYSYILQNNTSSENISNISIPVPSNISNTFLNTNTSAKTSFNISANTSTNTSANTSIPTLSNISNTFLNTNTSNISRPTLSNISNTSLNTYTPSPSVIDDIRVVQPTDVTPVAPSSRLIRGSQVIDTPSPQMNLTSLSPSYAVDNTLGYIFIISFCFLLIIIIVGCFIRIRHRNKLKIPFNKGKLKNTKDRKYIKGKIYTSTVTPNHLIQRPKDFVIEYLDNNEQKTNRQMPHPPSKEETEDHDTNDTPPSE